MRSHTLDDPFFGDPEATTTIHLLAQCRKVDNPKLALTKSEFDGCRDDIVQFCNKSKDILSCLKDAKSECLSPSYQQVKAEALRKKNEERLTCAKANNHNGLCNLFPEAKECGCPTSKSNS